MTQPSSREFGIFRDGTLVSDAYSSKYAAAYELEHRTNAGGEWDGQDPSTFAIKPV